MSAEPLMRRRRALALAIGISGYALAPGTGTAQLVTLRVASVEMQGGAVLASDFDTGVTFGTRLAVFELFGRQARAGLDFTWWTADRDGQDIEVRDVAIGLSIWRSARSPASLLRPYVGATGAVHSLNTSRDGGAPFFGERPAAARRLEGLRVGASLFAGVSLRLTATGAIRLLMEYRFTILSRPTHHELRAGARLLLSAR